MAQTIDTVPPEAELRIAMTYEEWLAWPGSTTKRTEWVDGEAFVSTPTKTVHAPMSILVARLLGGFVDVVDLGVVIHSPFEMRLERSAREPDILFVAAAHLDPLTPDRLIGPADLVVEFISDDSITRDRVENHREYAAAGVPEYRLFDPRPGRQRADGFGLDADGASAPIPPDAAGRVHSRVLPGFRLDPARLWQELLPKPAALPAQIDPAGRRSGAAASPGAPGFFVRTAQSSPTFSGRSHDDGAAPPPVGFRHRQDDRGPGGADHPVPNHRGRRVGAASGTMRARRGGVARGKTGGSRPGVGRVASIEEGVRAWRPTSRR